MIVSSRASDCYIIIITAINITMIVMIIMEYSYSYRLNTVYACMCVCMYGNACMYFCWGFVYATMAFPQNNSLEKRMYLCMHVRMFGDAWQCMAVYVFIYEYMYKCIFTNNY